MSVGSRVARFFWYYIPNNHKIYVPKDDKTYHVTTRYVKWPQNVTNDLKICHHFRVQDPLNFIQIGIFGMKIYHLATLVGRHPGGGVPFRE
jgi:hypothetical protein